MRARSALGHKLLRWANRAAPLCAVGLLAACAHFQVAAPARADYIPKTPCSPGFNGPGTPPAGSVIAPGLRVIKSSFSSGDCEIAIRVFARSADGTLWACGGLNGLWKSTDDMASWRRTYRATRYSQIQNILPLSSGHLLILVQDANRSHYVLRSTDSSATRFSATPVLSFPPNSRLLGSQSWVETGGAIYVAQYGDPDPPVRLWKSTDDGRSFSVAYSYTDARHFHSVQADPFDPGRIWLTIGDSKTQPRIGYSTDGGATFHFITEVIYPRSRAVSLMFAPDAVYWGADSSGVPAGAYRWDRNTGQITTVLMDLNGPFYDAVSHDGIYAQFSGVEDPVYDGYIGDEYIHVLSSMDGRSWSVTKTPFMRSQTPPRQRSVVSGITAPDSHGRFWVSFWNVQGTDARTSNVKFQLDPTALYSGPVQLLAGDTHLLVQPSSFVAAGSGATIGTTVSYIDSQPATTTFTVQRPAPGVRKGKRCVKAAKGKRCTRYLNVGSFTHVDAAGANRFHFTGRIRGQKLRPGKYRLQAVPRNAAGTGPAAYRSFGVKR